MKSFASWTVRTLLVVGIASVAGTPEAGAVDSQVAHATFHDAAGKEVGVAGLEETPNGVLISLDLTSLPPGPHAFHIHAIGKCEPPFKTAGGHFNPMEKQHGLKNPNGMHAGDFPNIVVPAGGKLEVRVLASHVTLGEGANSLFDADGAALVIHAGPDDYTSDPAGNAGDRIACAVIGK